MARVPCFLQDDVGGLEVEITEEKWIEAKPIPGRGHLLFVKVKHYSYENVRFSWNEGVMTFQENSEVLRKCDSKTKDHSLECE